MFNDEAEESNRTIWGLSKSQTGIVFLIFSFALAAFVAYQLKTGQVFTKSGVTTIQQGVGFLAIESFAAVLGMVRGINKLAP